MRVRSALVVGAGIAGSTVAYRLGRQGIATTVVALAEAPRSSGSPVDVRGGAVDVVARMQLLEPLRDAATRAWRDWSTGRIARMDIRLRPARRSRRPSARCAGRIPGGVSGAWRSSWAGGDCPGPVPSLTTIYRVLVRHGLINPVPRRRRREDYRRWERNRPMELWQLDIVDGIHLAHGSEAKVVTGVDDRSRYCVIAHVV